SRTEELRFVRQRHRNGLCGAEGRAVHHEIDRRQSEPPLRHRAALEGGVRAVPRAAADGRPRKAVGGVSRRLRRRPLVTVDIGSGGPLADTHAPGGPPARSRVRARLAEVAGRGLLAAPSVSWTFLFFIAPLGLLLVYSFGTTNLLTFQVDFGWTL